MNMINFEVDRVLHCFKSDDFIRSESSSLNSKNNLYSMLEGGVTVNLYFGGDHSLHLFFHDELVNIDFCGSNIGFNPHNRTMEKYQELKKQLLKFGILI